MAHHHPNKEMIKKVFKEFIFDKIDKAEKFETDAHDGDYLNIDCGDFYIGIELYGDIRWELDDFLWDHNS